MNLGLFETSRDATLIMLKCINAIIEDESVELSTDEYIKAVIIKEYLEELEAL